MQNGFCHPSGSFGKVGFPFSRHMAIVPTIQHLASLCRTRGIPVIYTRMEFDEDLSGAGLMFEGMPEQMKESGAFIRGSWDAQIIDDVRPDPNDLVVSKTRHSAFFNTDLKILLEKWNVKQIIATGVGTNVCVESTVREATTTHGFHSLTVSDGTGTLSEAEQIASMTNLRYFGGTISSEDLEKELLARDKGHADVTG